MLPVGEAGKPQRSRERDMRSALIVQRQHVADLVAEIEMAVIAPEIFRAGESPGDQLAQAKAPALGPFEEDLVEGVEQIGAVGLAGVRLGPARLRDHPRRRVAMQQGDKGAVDREAPAQRLDQTGSDLPSRSSSQFSERTIARISANQPWRCAVKELSMAAFSRGFSVSSNRDCAYSFAFAY